MYYYGHCINNGMYTLYYMNWVHQNTPSFHILYCPTTSFNVKTSLALYSKDDPWMRQSIFWRKLSREPIFDWYCSTEIPILVLLLTKINYRGLADSTVCGWFFQFDSTTTARTTQAQESFFCFHVHCNFRAFQKLSHTFRYLTIRPVALLGYGPIAHSKPHDNHSVHCDKCRNKYLWWSHCVVYTSCKPPNNKPWSALRTHVDKRYIPKC